MKITLLGTGADHCIPAFRCTCPVCMDAREKKGRRIRLNSSAIIKSEKGDLLLIDMPPQIMYMLSKNNIADTKIENILITHRHEDHTLGLRYFFHASAKKGFSIINKVNLYIPETAFESISKKLLSDKNIDFLPVRSDFYHIHIVKDSEPIKIRNWKVLPIGTGHLKESLGYIIENYAGKTCVYLLDAAVNIPKNTLSSLKKVHINCLIGDCTYENAQKSSSHMNINTLIKLTKELEPERTIASHISHMNLEYSKLKRELNMNDIELGYDGMRLTI